RDRHVRYGIRQDHHRRASETSCNPARSLSTACLSIDMATSTLNNVRFSGMATCVPKHVVHNVHDVPPHLRSERERLVRNIGIETRRVCPDWQCFSDLAYD